MDDRDFLKWLHARLQIVHGEDPCIDYMLKLASIANATPAHHYTPNIATVIDSANMAKSGVALANK